MPANSFEELVTSDLAPEQQVRQGLRLLEGDFRERALRALAGWEQLAVAAPVSLAAAPELFSAIASLQRPSWGGWNGLVTALRKARTAILRDADDLLRRRLEQADDLNTELDRLDETVEPVLVDGLQPLIRLVRGKLAGHPRLRQVLALPISLRNRMAHDMPSEPAWWREAADALRPLLVFQSRSEPLGRRAFPAPWFVVEAEQVWSFNGLEHDGSAVYVSQHGATRSDPGQSQAVLLAFRRLLGQTDVQERDFKKLLSALAPDDVKGVLLGDYLLGRPVGAGGFATVHTGRQLSTNRKVAIKVLRDGMDVDQRRRFQQEASFLARLDHPNIVSVLGHGEDTWSPPRAFSLSGEEWFQQLAREAPIKSFIALEWIEGQTLDAIIRQDRTSGPSVRVLAEWFAQSAEALAVVHGAGLLHRDLKPSNLMVSTAGQVKLMDFGIARTQADVRTINTATGQFLGTPAYMAPEQLKADAAQAAVGPASDLYGLCATYYELFTGSRLFNHDTLDQVTVVTRKLAGDRPDPPRRLAPDLPWEIETLLLGGLEREPKDRPAGAAELAADLRRFLANQAIRYKRPPLRRRVQLWHRRHRATVRVVAPILGALAIIASVFGYSWYAAHEAAQSLEGQVGGLTGEVASATKTAASAKGEAKESSALKYRRDYIADMVRLPAAWEKGDLAQVNTVLDRYRPDRSGKDDQRGVEWYYWSWLSHNSAVNHFLHATEGDKCLAFSPDGKMLAVAGGSDITLYDLKTSAEVAVIRVPSTVSCIAFSPDGARLAGRADGVRNKDPYHPALVRVWETTTGKELLKMKTPRGGNVTALVFNLDGKLLGCSWHTSEVSGDPNPPPPGGGAIVWDLNNGAEKLKVSADAIGDHFLFTPDGKSLVTAEGKRQIHVRQWDIETGKDHSSVLWLSQNPKYREYSPVAWSPDGHRLVVESSQPDGSANLVLLQAASSKSFDLGPRGRDTLLTFSPNGDYLASAAGSVVNVVNTSDGKLKRAYRAATTQITALTFSADGKRLASASHNDVRVWDVNRPQERFTPVLTSGGNLRGFGRRRGGNGTLEALVDKTGLLTVWDGDSKRLPLQCQLPPEYTGGLALSADGKIVAAASRKTLGVWDLTTGKPVLTASIKSGVDDPIISPDGRQVAVWLDADKHGDLPISSWETSTGQQLFKIPGFGPGRTGKCMAYTPDGRELVVGGDGNKLSFFDARTGKRTRILVIGDQDARHMAFSPDGKRVAVGGRVLRIWDLASGKETLIIGADVQGDLQFSPDGKLLGCGGRLFDVQLGEELLRVIDKSGLSIAELFGQAGQDLIELGTTGKVTRLAAQGKVEERESSASPPTTAKVVPPAQFVSLFNGNDLTSWKTNPAVKSEWHVEDGAIVSVSNGRLYTSRNNYSDFHLRAEVRLEDGAVGSLQFRSNMQMGSAYAVVLHAKADHDLSAGSLVDLRGGSAALRTLSVAKGVTLQPDHWHALEVIAAGWKFVVKIDGQVVVEVADNLNAHAKGFIALQRRVGIEKTIRFRKIEIMELTTP